MDLKGIKRGFWIAYLAIGAVVVGGIAAYERTKVVEPTRPIQPTCQESKPVDRMEADFQIHRKGDK